jgi:hypothetical protein
MRIEEKAELFQLLQEQMMTPFERRVKRLKDAQVKLFGRDANGNPLGTGVADILERARHGKPLSDDEWTIAHFGCTKAEMAEYRRLNPVDRSQKAKA